MGRCKKISKILFVAKRVEKKFFFSSKFFFERSRRCQCEPIEFAFVFFIPSVLMVVSVAVGTVLLWSSRVLTTMRSAAVSLPRSPLPPGPVAATLLSSSFDLAFRTADCCCCWRSTSWLRSKRDGPAVRVTWLSPSSSFLVRVWMTRGGGDVMKCGMLRGAGWHTSPAPT